MNDVRVSVEGPDGEPIAGWTTTQQGEHRPEPDPADINDPAVSLYLTRLRQTNEARCARWHPEWPNDNWTAGDWANAMQGEAGEVAQALLELALSLFAATGKAGNVAKKIRRAEEGLVGANDPVPEKLVVALANEIADTVIYADLLAAKFGINLGAAIINKFNAVSIREGFPERL